MPSKKRITPAERRHRDYLRRKTLRVASVYETRLEAARRKELRRVLSMAMDYSDPVALIPLIEGQIDETGYLGKWWQGLIVDAGLPIAKATARDLLQAKAAAEEGIWLTALRNYATTRAGNEIVIVSGTWKDTLVRIVRNILSEDRGLGIEKVTKELYKRYTGNIQKWQCRRIAQTEAMIGMAQAANDAAKTLSISFTKEWCISGLGNTRPSHEAMDGVTVDEDEPFVLPGGMMMFPHDTSMNADAGEIINCACDCIRKPKNNLAEAPEQPSEPEQPVEAPAQETQTAEDQAREQRIQEIIAEMPEDMADDVKRAIAENDLELEKTFGIKKGAPMTVEKADTQSANPKWRDKFVLDPLGDFIDSEGRHYSKNKSYQKQYTINCATCTPAYELRRRGFNVTAKGNKKGTLNEQASHGKTWAMWKNADGTAASPTTMNDWMKKKGYLEMSSERYSEFFEESCKQQGTYAMTIKWQGKSSGHATILFRDTDGKLYYIEPQRYEEEKGVKRSIDELCKYGAKSPRDKDGVMRLDDKVFDTGWAKLFNTKRR